MTGQLAPTDRCTAAHELGHAFGLRRAGLTPDRLVVRRILGGGWCAAKENQVEANHLWDFAVALACGRAAEELYRTENGLSGPWSWGTSGDEQMFASLFVPRDDCAYLTEGTWNEALGDAASNLAEEWDELEPLILPLAHYGTLYGIPA